MERPLSKLSDLIDAGLYADDWTVREWFVRRADKLTPEQVARCLQDGDSAVRTALAERPDFLPTQEQMARGLKDTDEEVRWVFEDRRVEWETKTLKDKHSAVVKKPAKRTAL